jgi:tRNA-dihydrouridine synthase
LGFDSIIVERWISHLLEERPAVISIHGRTLQQMYRGQADWQAIARAARVAKGTDTLILGNGDVQTMHEVICRVRHSRVDGVLIGRGTLGQPWFFQTKEKARVLAAQDSPMESMAGGNSLDVDLGLNERFQVLLEHARHFEALWGAERFPRMRKHLGWYCKGFPHAAALRAEMVRASSAADVERILGTYRDRLGVSSGIAASASSEIAPVSLLPCA